MSYNVTTWKTKKLRNLTIPVNALFAVPDWQLNQSVDDGLGGTFAQRWGKSYIKGALVGEPVTQRNGFLPPDSTQMLAVDEISASGDGSGSLLWKVINPALEKGKGRLVAVRIWEGGDSVDRLVVVDGDVNEQDVDL